MVFALPFLLIELEHVGEYERGSCDTWGSRKRGTGDLVESFLGSLTNCCRRRSGLVATIVSPGEGVGER